MTRAYAPEPNPVEYLWGIVSSIRELMSASENRLESSCAACCVGTAQSTLSNCRLSRAFQEWLLS